MPRAHEIYSLLERRRERTQRRSRSFHERFRRLALGFAALLALLFAGGSLYVGLAYADLTHDLPSLAALPAYFNLQTGAFLQPTRLYDRTGQHLLRTLSEPGINRRYLPLDPKQAEHLSPDLARLAVSILDPGFRTHPGFTASGLLDASHQPATLAERLASDLLLGQEKEGLRRALRERLLAAQLTNHYGRDQILEWYLNSAYFGRLAYGADAAAQTYLGKPASRLDLAESALLVALIQTPALNPLDAPDAAREREIATLDLALGHGTITAVEYQVAREEKLVFRASLEGTPATSLAKSAQTEFARAFTDQALAQLAPGLGTQRIERGGLEIWTTLDEDLQRQLACAAGIQVRRLAGREAPAPQDCPAARLLPTLPSGLEPLPEALSASAVILDPASGQVLALVGETNARGESHALLRHAGGTVLSPLIYLAGFTRGMSPATLVWDIPPMANPVSEAGGAGAALQNLDGSYHGPLRLRSALANDYWAPAEELLRQIGSQNVWSLVGSFGVPLPSAQVRSSPDDFTAVPLGLVETAQAYAVFANQGVLAGRDLSPGPLSAAFVLRVSERGSGRTLLDWSQPQSQAVLSPPLAHLVNAVLSDESARWPTLGYPNALEIGRPVGAHLGRSPDGADAWAVGYTPQRVTVVWMGAPSAGPQTRPLDPRLAAGLWHAASQYALRDLPVASWTAPPGISTLEVCDPSGMLPTANCPAMVSEVFLTGNEPTDADTLYRTFQVNRETGRLATVFTPPELVENRVYLVVPPEAEAWARAAGQPLPPQDYDTIQAPPVDPDVHVVAPEMFGVVRGEVEIRGTAGGAGFSFYRVQVGEGLNPQRWLQVGQDSSQAVQNGLLAAWDTRGLSGLYAVRLLVVRQDQKVETATLQVTVDNQAPEVRITYPTSGDHFSTNQRQITFQARASDAIALARVDWFLDGRLLASQAEEPFTYPWRASPSSSGRHTLQAKAIDRAGNATTSALIEFTLNR
ncbi:MAG TPA: transglycosylase domain-containing protein [Anaerolineaceae bacterium]|nr:transglycosylase domain-containing protein [Anaerolineaceae bacterium]